MPLIASAVNHSKERTLSTENEGFKNADDLTRWVRYLLYAQVIIILISIFSGYLERQLLLDFQNSTYLSQEQAIADAEASDQRQGLVAITYLVIYIVSIICIGKWIYRANYNARQLGAQGMKFSPGWSVGYFFIPILLLWKPFQAMKEIWKASKNPSDWQNEDVDGIVSVWWALWLVSNFLGQYVFKLSLRAQEIEELLRVNTIYMISDIVSILLALSFLSVVKSIYNMQMGHHLDNMRKHVDEWSHSDNETVVRMIK